MDDTSVPISIASILLTLFFAASIYVWVSLALSALFRKLGEEGWKAWVPVYNTVTIYRLGGVSGLWVITLFSPLSIIGLVYFVIAQHHINTRFGKGAGYTVLAIFATPIWASILGWGSATPHAPGVQPLPAPLAAPFGAAPQLATAPPQSAGKAAGGIAVAAPYGATVGNDIPGRLPVGEQADFGRFPGAVEPATPVVASLGAPSAPPFDQPVAFEAAAPTVAAAPEFRYTPAVIAAPADSAPFDPAPLDFGAVMTAPPVAAPLISSPPAVAPLVAELGTFNHVEDEPHAEEPEPVAAETVANVQAPDAVEAGHVEALVDNHSDNDTDADFAGAGAGAGTGESAGAGDEAGNDANDALGEEVAPQGDSAIAAVEETAAAAASDVLTTSDGGHDASAESSSELELEPEPVFAAEPEVSFAPESRVAPAPGAPAPIELPAELSIRTNSGTGAQAAPARALIESVPDFSTPPAPVATRPTAASVVLTGVGSGIAHGADFDDDMDETIIAGRRNKAWIFETAEGQRVPLTSSTIVLGRNPLPVVECPDAQLITVRDPGRTISKTHARIELVEGVWSITDLNSTNGVYLIAGDDEELELDAGQTAAIGDRFVLGEMSARIFQED